MPTRRSTWRGCLRSSVFMPSMVACPRALVVPPQTQNAGRHSAPRGVARRPLLPRREYCCYPNEGAEFSVDEVVEPVAHLVKELGFRTSGVNSVHRSEVPDPAASMSKRRLSEGQVRIARLRGVFRLTSTRSK